MSCILACKVRLAPSENKSSVLLMDIPIRGMQTQQHDLTFQGYEAVLLDFIPTKMPVLIQ